MAASSSKAILPVHLDGIVPGSVKLSSSAAKPNEMILSAQVTIAPCPDRFALVLRLARSDAQRLAKQLKDELCADCPRVTP